MSSDPNSSAFGDAILAQQTSSLIIKNTATMDSVQGGTLAEPHEALMGPLVFEAVNGDATAESAQLLMVPMSCSNPELAWEFIKFCIAPLEEEIGEQSDISDKTGGRKYYPVFKTNPAAYAEYYRAFGNADFDRYLEKLEERIREIHKFDIYKLHAYGVTYPILELYFDYGTITAEECARQIDERLYVYLNE